jgi:hypothetical protein
MLKRLETERETSAVWQELWNELHHQGDVGEASFAVVPYLVRAYRERRVVDWNTYAIVAVIELARKEGKNPDVPEWLEAGYFAAIRELAKMGAADIARATTPEDVRAILSVLAIEKGLRTHGRFLVIYDESELLDIESRV